MAREAKTGLDYFPLNVDFFTDDKLEFVSARFDEKGELIAIKLLCKIYKNGYFIKWDQDTCLLFAKAAGKGISPGLVNDVVNELLKRDFFDEVLHKRFGILTSHGIQKRYTRICKDSKRIGYEIPESFRSKPKFPELLQFTPEETPIIQGESTQRKEKEIKEKESISNTPADTHTNQKPGIKNENEILTDYFIGKWNESTKLKKAVVFPRSITIDRFFLNDSKLVTPIWTKKFIDDFILQCESQSWIVNERKSILFAIENYEKILQGDYVDFRDKKTGPTENNDAELDEILKQSRKDAGL